MNNPNQELLDFAVKNIKKWDENYTHIRSDNGLYPLFFSKGSGWSVYNDAWGYDVGRGVSNEWSKINLSFKTNTPQIISKEEWLNAKSKLELERYEKYDLSIILTGEQIALLYFLICSVSSGTCKVSDIFDKFNTLFPKLSDGLFTGHVNIKDTIGKYSTLQLHDNKEFNEWLDSKFHIETEEEKELRELKEQRDALNELINKLEKQ